MDISIVIPVKNEFESIEILLTEIDREIRSLKKTWEVIIVDDGSTDGTFEKLKKIKGRYRNIHVYKLRGNFGKSTGLSVGFEKSKGNMIITMDGDLQDNPKEISRFLKKLEEGYDLVSGWKKERHDPSLSKVLPSRIFNFLVRKLTNVPVHDTNCGFKAYKRDVVENINLYGELYRFIPIIASKQNFRVTEIVVEHRKRKYGKSKYGWARMIKGMLDLITVVFLTGYIRRPGHFFGGLGMISFFFGFLIGIYITYLRVTTGTIQDRQPLLFLGMLLMIIGIQLFSTGLLAEMFTSWRQEGAKYGKSVIVDNI